MMRTPQPTSESQDAVEHSRRLANLIREEAAHWGGLLPFDRFMDLVLYAPGLGYYVAGARKLGSGGDFVTAPEISPFFGRCIAVQCREVLDHLGGGDILELGAGTGALAAQVLSALDEARTLPGRYLILEVSPELKERQQALLAERLPRMFPCIRWLERLPEDFRGVVLANEVLDAMPVHRFRILPDGTPAEVFVSAAGEGWEEREGTPVSPGLTAAVRSLQDAGLAVVPGYGSEINLRLKPWLAALSEAMDRGFALLIDYGYSRHEYYRPDRRDGTLMCHYRHLAHSDPYRNLGLQDITAHVDFSAVADGARAAELELAGYTTQAHFLLGCGLDRMLAEAAGGDGAMEALTSAKQLVLPQAMGERFRVMGLEKGIAGPWTGFSIRDLRERL
jgi:SAM-dependent MidA family methyltransferase